MIDTHTAWLGNMGIIIQLNDQYLRKLYIALEFVSSHGVARFSCFTADLGLFPNQKNFIPAAPQGALVHSHVILRQKEVIQIALWEFLSYLR